MPRIRTIKPEFWSDEKLSTLTVMDRFVFLGLISLADDFGRIMDNIKIIDAFVFPNTDETVRESLANLTQMGRVRRGNSASGQKIIEIVNWSKHQRVDKPQPKLCLPEIADSAQETQEKPKEKTIPESFANESRMKQELVAPRPTTNDQGTPTNDQRAGNEIDEAIASPPSSVSVETDLPNEDTPEQVLRFWNAELGQECTMTERRLRSLRQRIRDRTWRTNWREAIRRASHSDFCRGVNDRGWVADLEWFIKPDSVAKLLEGKYDNRASPRSRKADRIKNSIEEAFS